MPLLPDAPQHAAPSDSTPVPNAGMETAAIALGGAIGASLRFAAQKQLILPELGLLGEISLNTLAVNLLGTFSLGLLFGSLNRSQAHPLLRPFLGVGVLGSFTTYSAFVAEASLIAPEAGLATAFGFVLASLVMGVAAFEVGRSVTDAQDGPATR